MFGNNPYYPPNSGGSQPGRGDVRGNGDENQFAGSVYGHCMSQNPPGQPYYPQQEMSRRPLQSMQLENNQQMAARPQQQMYHGQVYSVPADLDHSSGYGRGFRGPAPFPPSSHPVPYRQPGQQGHSDVDMRFEGSAPRQFQGEGSQFYPPCPPMLLRAPAQDDVPLAGAGRGAGHSGGKRMYSEVPLYSGFTPLYTSSPITTSSTTPGTGTVSASMSTGRGYPVQPHQFNTATPVWACPAPKVPKVEQPGPGTSQGGSNSRVAATASSTTASSSSRPAMAAPATPSRSASPAPSSASSPTPRRQHERAAPAIERGIRVLTGSVDNILGWGRQLDEEARPHILFEIVGSLDSVVHGQWSLSQLVCLRGLDRSKNGKNTTISAVFWEIDRPLCPPPLGSTVSCICRLGPKHSAGLGVQLLQAVPKRRLPRMQVLKMRALSPGQVVHCKRMAFVSTHAVSQGALKASYGEPEQAGATAPPAPATQMKQTLISSYSSTKVARP